VGLSRLRRVFVDDLLSKPDRPGRPNLDGVAIAMGNSVETWFKSYWKNGRYKLQREACQQLSTYRAALLREHVQRMARNAQPAADAQ
jgi:hypothetical protein